VNADSITVARLLFRSGSSSSTPVMRSVRAVREREKDRETHGEQNKLRKFYFGERRLARSYIGNTKRRIGMANRELVPGSTSRDRERITGKFDLRCFLRQYRRMQATWRRLRTRRAIQINRLCRRNGGLRDEYLESRVHRGYNGSATMLDCGCSRLLFLFESREFPLPFLPTTKETRIVHLISRLENVISLLL